MTYDQYKVKIWLPKNSLLMEWKVWKQSGISRFRKKPTYELIGSGDGTLFSQCSEQAKNCIEFDKEVSNVD